MADDPVEKKPDGAVPPPKVDPVKVNDPGPAPVNPVGEVKKQDGAIPPPEGEPAKATAAEAAEPDDKKPKYDSQVIMLGEDVPSPFFVGLTVSIEISIAKSKPRRIQTGIMGWYKNQYLLLVVFNPDPEISSAPLGTPLVCRYVSAGKVYGFASRILSKQLNPVSVWYAEFPQQMEVLNLRGSTRIPLGLDVKTADDEMFSTKDISRTGVLLFGSLKTKKLERKIGDQLVMNISFLNQLKIDGVKGTVARKQEDKDQQMIGVQFTGDNEESMKKLVQFIEGLEAVFLHKME